MAVTIQLPPDIEQRLRAEMPDLDDRAREAALVQLYRDRKLSHGQVAKILGISRYELDGILKKHGVCIEQSAEDVARESR